MIVATRYHDFSAGHRVAGHENKCAQLHGHNYRVHFDVEAQELDTLGRVVDFSVIKSLLCMWLEEHWDHRFLLWCDDPFLKHLGYPPLQDSLVLVPFNPTAENMARHLGEVVGPMVLPEGLRLVGVRVEETRKCAAEWMPDDWPDEDDDAEGP